MATQRLRATRDLIYNNSMVRKGQEFDYSGDKPHKYAVPAEQLVAAPQSRKVADLKPEAARKAARQKAVDPTGDDSQA